MKKALIVVFTSLSLTLIGCGATKDVAQEQKEANQRNELFTTTKAAIDKLTDRLTQARSDNLAYYAKRLYKDALDEMEDVNDEFDDIRFSPQKASRSNTAEIMSYVLKTNLLLDQAYIVKKTITTTLAETTEQMTRLKVINVDKLYPRTFKKYDKKVDSMVKDIADGDIKSAQNEQANLLPLLYALEGKALKHIKLSALQKSLDSLKSSNVKRIAPISFQKAVASIQSAESVINADPRATEAIDASVEKVKLEIAHVRHIILEIKSLGAVKTKNRETYILQQENQINTIAQALNLTDIRALPINEQYNKLTKSVNALTTESAQVQTKLTSLEHQLLANKELMKSNNQDGKATMKKLDEKLVYIGQLEQQLAYSKTAHVQALLVKDNEILKVKNSLQQLQLTATKLQTKPLPTQEITEPESKVSALEVQKETTKVETEKAVP